MAYFADSHARPAPTRNSLFALVGRLIATSRQRAELRALEPHLLVDLGITAEAAEKEAQRPFWDLDPSQS